MIPAARHRCPAPAPHQVAAAPLARRGRCTGQKTLAARCQTPISLRIFQRLPLLLRTHLQFLTHWMLPYLVICRSCEALPSKLQPVLEARLMSSERARVTEALVSSPRSGPLWKSLGLAPR